MSEVKANIIIKEINTDITVETNPINVNLDDVQLNIVTAITDNGYIGVRNIPITEPRIISKNKNSNIKINYGDEIIRLIIP